MPVKRRAGKAKLEFTSLAEIHLTIGDCLMPALDSCACGLSDAAGALREDRARAMWRIHRTEILAAWNKVQRSTGTGGRTITTDSASTAFRVSRRFFSMAAYYLRSMRLGPRVFGTITTPSRPRLTADCRVPRGGSNPRNGCVTPTTWACCRNASRVTCRAPAACSWYRKSPSNCPAARYPPPRLGCSSHRRCWHGCRPAAIW